MAARLSGSGRNNLLLASADRWRTSYSVAEQDCALHSATVGDTGVALGRTGTKSVVTNGLPGVFVGGADSPLCKPAERVLSLRPKPSQAQPRAAVRLKGQPLFVSGDVVFTERALGGGASSVVVERLTSNEVGTLSLETLSQDLPAAPRLEVQADEFTAEMSGQVLIPFNYHVGSTQAVSTRNFVFYAVPPALDCFTAYFEYCYNMAHNASSLPRMGFLLRSSYAPVRVYRVAAYRQCTGRSCGDDLVRHVQFDGMPTDFLAGCGDVFNASIASLEYLNEDNIAVVMQVGFIQKAFLRAAVPALDQELLEVVHIHQAPAGGIPADAPDQPVIPWGGQGADGAPLQPEAVAVVMLEHQLQFGVDALFMDPLVELLHGGVGEQHDDVRVGGWRTGF